MTSPHAHTTHRRPHAMRRSVKLVAVALLLEVAAVAFPIANSAQAAARSTGVDVSRPHLLTSGLAGVMVHIGGGANCTGTPITATRFVVTAAHCVLDHDGRVGRRTVHRDGVEYTPVAVLVDPAYHNAPGPNLDAAVLIMNRPIPGPSATLGDAMPTSGSVTLAGFQPLDTDGSLLRGTRYDNRPLPQGTHGGVITIRTAVAGCTQPATHLTITATQVKMTCGLIPGSSGGGLFTQQHHNTVLIGIVSTVAQDLTYNGIVPLPALLGLLDHPTMHTYQMPPTSSTHSVSNTERS